MSKAQGLPDKLEEQFRHDYQDPNLTMQQLEEIYHHPMGTLWRWAYQLGVRRPVRGKRAEITKDDLLHSCMEAAKHVPTIKIAETEPPEIGFGQEMQLLLNLADLHLGRKTISYDPAVALRRMDKLRIEVLNELELLRHRYSIRKLILTNLGDIVTGEMVGFQMKLEDLAAVIMEQIFNIAIPYECNLIEALLPEFDEILVTGVPGNHGKFNRFASGSANWDTIAYYGMKERMRKAKKVKFQVDFHSWYQYVDIFNFVYLLIHGDQFPAKAGFSSKPVMEKALKWQHSLPRPFTNLIAGHFHSRHTATITGCRVDIFPTLLSDDEWAKETLGLEAECAQTLLGITEEGIQYERTIRLGGIT